MGQPSCSSHHNIPTSWESLISPSQFNVLCDCRARHGADIHGDAAAPLSIQPGRLLFVCGKPVQGPTARKSETTGATAVTSLCTSLVVNSTGSGKAKSTPRHRAHGELWAVSSCSKAISVGGLLLSCLPSL